MPGPDLPGSCRAELARPTGIEPVTPSLEGWCSIRLSYGRVPGQSNGRQPKSAIPRPLSVLQNKYRNRYMVGVEGFEPPTPCSQSRCATRLRYTPMTVTRPGQHRATRLHSGAAPGAALDPKTQSQAGAAQGRRIYALPPLWSMAEEIAVLGARLIACHDAPLFRVRRFWLDYGCRNH